MPSVVVMVAVEMVVMLTVNQPVDATAVAAGAG